MRHLYEWLCGWWVFIFNINAMMIHTRAEDHLHFERVNAYSEWHFFLSILINFKFFPARRLEFDSHKIINFLFSSLNWINQFFFVLLGDSIRYLPCMHQYHVHCVDNWLMRSNQFSCPSCCEPIDAALLSSFENI